MRVAVETIPITTNTTSSSSGSGSGSGSNSGSGGGSSGASGGGGEGIIAALGAVDVTGSSCRTARAHDTLIDE
jgi:hypothetical protein